MKKGWRILQARQGQSSRTAQPEGEMHCGPIKCTSGRNPTNTFVEADKKVLRVFSLWHKLPLWYHTIPQRSTVLALKYYSYALMKWDRERVIFFQRSYLQLKCFTPSLRLFSALEAPDSTVELFHLAQLLHHFQYFPSRKLRRKKNNC